MRSVSLPEHRPLVPQREGGGGAGGDLRVTITVARAGAIRHRARGQRHHLAQQRIIAVQHGKRAHLAQELAKTLVQVFRGMVEIEMIDLDIRHDRRFRGKAEERIIRLARFHQRERAAGTGIAAQPGQFPAQHAGGIMPGFQENHRQHAAGGGFAVRAAHRDTPRRCSSGRRAGRRASRWATPTRARAATPDYPA